MINGTPTPKLYYLPMSWLLGDSNDWEWMQYTGLRDKNSKEIYCSDVVKGCFDPDKVEDWIWLGLSEDEKKNGWRIFKIPDNLVDYAREFYPDDLEVIGNIYENPELLEEESK